MLPVAVDHPEDPAACMGPATGHSRCETRSSGASDHAESGQFGGEVSGDLPGAVGTVVVDDQDLEADVAIGQHPVEGAQQHLDVAGLLIGGDDEAQDDRRVVLR